MFCDFDKTEFCDNANKEIVFADLFGTLCGGKIGSGASRDVYICEIMPEYVVKVAKDAVFNGVNQNYQEYRVCQQLIKTRWAKYLAPVFFASHNYIFLLQKKCLPLREHEIPKRVPRFLNDRKQDNWGVLNGKVVCFDYGIANYNIPESELKLEKWENEK